MNLLDFYIPEWFIVALNLVILIVVLRAVLWKRVIGVLEARQAQALQAKENFDVSQREKDGLEVLRQETQRGIEANKTKLLGEARTSAGREYDRIVSEAEQKAGQIISAARSRAEQEEAYAKNELVKELSTMAVDAASALMRTKMDEDANKKLVESFIATEDAGTPA